MMLRPRQKRVLWVLIGLSILGVAATLVVGALRSRWALGATAMTPAREPVKASSDFLVTRPTRS